MACPLAIAPDEALRLTRASPLFSALLQQTDRGLSEQRTADRGSGSETVVAIYPHPLIVGERTSAQSVLTINYSAGTSNLDRLDQNRTWESDVTLKSGSHIIGKGSATLTMLDKGLVSIGECEYEAWRVENRLEIDGRSPIVFEKFYSPLLGVVIKTIKIAPDGKRLSAVEFDEIELVKAF